MNKKQWYKVELTEIVTRVASVELQAFSDEEAEKLAREKVLGSPDLWTEVESQGIDASIVMSEN